LEYTGKEAGSFPELEAALLAFEERE